MIGFHFYESINCNRSHIFDRYKSVTDIFTKFSKPIKYRYKSPEVFKRSKLLHKINDCFQIPDHGRGCNCIRPTHDCNILEVGPDDCQRPLYFIEFKILDTNLINSLIDTGNLQFLINRYVVEWSSGNYFMEKLLGYVFLVQDDIFVIRCKMVSKISHEDLNLNPISINREIKLDKLF